MIGELIFGVRPGKFREPEALVMTPAQVLEERQIKSALRAIPPALARADVAGREVACSKEEIAGWYAIELTPPAEFFVFGDYLEPFAPRDRHVIELWEAAGSPSGRFPHDSTKVVLVATIVDSPHLHWVTSDDGSMEKSTVLNLDTKDETPLRYADLAHLYGLSFTPEPVDDVEWIIFDPTEIVGKKKLS